MMLYILIVSKVHFSNLLIISSVIKITPKRFSKPTSQLPYNSVLI